MVNFQMGNPVYISTCFFYVLLYRHIPTIASIEKTIKHSATCDGTSARSSASQNSANPPVPNNTFTTGVNEHGSTSSDQLVARVDAHNVGIHIQSTASAPTDSFCDIVDSVELDAVAIDDVSIPNLSMVLSNGSLYRA
ncbi:hypothetical protein DAPPUDRAFT_310837 [Daphnia pulex]|uniref:Uncharacterized protein n=1 Tax=Daphnia pulex TaxID=6669 RepID=E9FVR2_DAPPU|nr:hypothetical protein DAPPUDRAFT_310837 [Daphnia pulex]|eukprot:EFX89058.1 hypothetical protein DAPPUDRAFT_310837 [Daphnia pulex]